MKSVTNHRRRANRTVKNVCAGVLTVSDTRKKCDDISGQVIMEKLASQGVQVIRYTLVKDEISDIRSALQGMLAEKGIDIIIITGGTGVAPRDITPEAVYPYIEKPLDGFGEVFRALSFEEIGPASILSRAFAGVTKTGVVIFALPGSPEGVTLALERIILPELKHIVSLLRA